MDKKDIHDLDISHHYPPLMSINKMVFRGVSGSKAEWRFLQTWATFAARRAVEVEGGGEQGDS